MGGLEGEDVSFAQVPDALLDAVVLAIESVRDHGPEGHASIDRSLVQRDRNRQLGAEGRV